MTEHSFHSTAALHPVLTIVPVSLTVVTSGDEALLLLLQLRPILVSNLVILGDVLSRTTASCMPV